eukprot:3085054-Rhodomonas_salina.1
MLAVAVWVAVSVLEAARYAPAICGSASVMAAVLSLMNVPLSFPASVPPGSTAGIYGSAAVIYSLNAAIYGKTLPFMAASLTFPALKLTFFGSNAMSISNSPDIFRLLGQSAVPSVAMEFVRV